MKKIISVLFAIVVMAGISAVVSSCSKNGNDTDYYSFNFGINLNSKCDFDAIDDLYQSKYQGWRVQCSDMSYNQAKAKWAEAEKEFKAVESKLVAEDGGWYEIKMERYSIVGDAYTPVETIGIWRFPALK